MWPWILIERESSWSWSLRKRYIQCHINPVLIPPRKPPDPAMYLYNGHTYDLETRVDIWTMIDVVPVEYGSFAQEFHLAMSFFHFITGINFNWDYVLLHIIALLVWIGLWTKLSIHRVPTDPVRWSCLSFGSL